MGEGNPTRGQIEAEHMERVPGVIFADGPAGRRARIAGTGIEVFEVAQVYRDTDGDFESVVRCFDWLTGEQIVAAVDYYRAYPDEINARLDAEDALVPEEARQPKQERRAS